MKATALSWIAGFWEGEGSVGYYRVNRNRDGRHYKSGRLYATITQINRPSLEWIKRTTGMGSISVQDNNRNNPYGWPCKKLYRFAVANAVARQFFALILPYVRTPHKRKQLLKALAMDRKYTKGRWPVK